MAESSIVQMTIACHVSIDIACSPERVWQSIESAYAQGKKFSATGYRIEPLDDPTAFLGIYHMELEQGGVVVDERIVRVNELDAAARRLSLHGQYLSEGSNGLDVFATYQALPVSTGARFIIDCHAHYSRWPLPSENRAEIRAAIEALKVQSDTGLGRYLESFKAEIEREG